MEKILLKPAIKELVHRNGEADGYFDVTSYQGTTAQEKLLGSLFIVSHIKYSADDLSYALGLISSLAKREYYSELSFQEQNSKSAFERALKKLNEVLDDFFKNKDFKLNIGLMSISGDNIYISRLGKFKVALARDNQYIDVLNNVELFTKDTEGEKQFSNIISGKLRSDDKIFAYFPAKSITLREKQLNAIFVKEGQDEFGQKIAQLAANANNFSCCGVHLDIRQIKEIPVQAAPRYSTPATIASAPIDASQVETSNGKIPEEDKLEPSKVKTVASLDNESTQKSASTINSTDRKPQFETPAIAEQQRIIPAEFSMAKRGSIFTFLTNQFFKLASIGKLSGRARWRGFALVTALAIVPLTLIVILRQSGDSGRISDVRNRANNDLKLARSQLTQNKTKEARSLLQATLLNIADISNKKVDAVRQEIRIVLDGVDHASDKPAQLFSDLTATENPRAVLVAVLSDQPKISDANGAVYQAAQNNAVRLTEFKTTAKFIFDAKSGVFIFNGSDAFGAYNPATKKTAVYSLKEPAQSADAILYEDNLYALSENHIYKYADATTGGVKRANWGGDDSSGNLISLAADGNIYALTADGKLIKFFKGKKAGELDLQLVPSAGSRIFTYKDSAFIYLADKTAKRVYVFDKTTGELKTTYKLDPVGTPQDITVSPDGTVWTLSSDNKVWVLR